MPCEQQPRPESRLRKRLHDWRKFRALEQTRQMPQQRSRLHRALWLLGLLLSLRHPLQLLKRQEAY